MEAIPITHVTKSICAALIFIGFVLIHVSCGSGSGSSGSSNKSKFAPPAAGLFADMQLDVLGTTRYFDYYVPKNLRQNTPVVFLLHAGGQNRTDMLDGSSGTTEWKSIADDEKILLIIPNGADGAGNTNAQFANWNDCRADDTGNSTQDDVAFIEELITWANSRFDIDVNRIYATGASNGGMMCYRLALELGHKIGAIAAFIANNPAVSECTPFFQAVSVFIANGTDDTVIPWNGGTIDSTIGGTVVSALETRDFWRSYNGTLTEENPIDYPDLDPGDGSTVSSTRYSGGFNNAEVIFYTVDGGRHSMPSINFPAQNQDIEGARHAWDFMKKHRN